MNWINKTIRIRLVKSQIILTDCISANLCKSINTMTKCLHYNTSKLTLQNGIKCILIVVYTKHVDNNNNLETINNYIIIHIKYSLHGMYEVEHKAKTNNVSNKMTMILEHLPIRSWEWMNCINKTIRIRLTKSQLIHTDCSSTNLCQSINTISKYLLNINT